VKRWAFLIFCVAISVSLFKAFTPSEFSWHLKLTARIVTPEGPVTSSNVIEIRYKDNRLSGFGLPEASGVQSSVKGEALAVELPSKRVLFILLGDQAGQDTPADWPGRLWQSQSATFDDLVALIGSKIGAPPEALPAEQWPLMVTFRDLQNPDSLQVISGDDLSFWFGPGVRVDELSLQITREPATSGEITRLLPWLLEAGRDRGFVAPPPSPAVPILIFLSLDHWNPK